MDWLEEVRERQKRKNQILFGKDSDFLWDRSEEHTSELQSR